MKICFTEKTKSIIIHNYCLVSFHVLCFLCKQTEAYLHSVNSRRTSHTMKQSWFTPFFPLWEKTAAKFFDPSALTVPEERNINSFFLASLAISSAASRPTQFSEFLPFLMERDLANPLNILENGPINPAV